MDDDGSKSLNLEEFQKGLETYGLSIGKEKAKEIFTLVDKDRSGTIEFDEFLDKLRVGDQVQRHHSILFFHKTSQRWSSFTLEKWYEW